MIYYGEGIQTTTHSKIQREDPTSPPKYFNPYYRDSHQQPLISGNAENQETKQNFGWGPVSAYIWKFP